MLALPALALAAVVLAGIAPRALHAQRERPGKGKIDGVERSAGEARRDGSGDSWVEDDDESGFGIGAIFFGYPKGPGQGYLHHPYQASRRPFVLQDVKTGRRFVTVSGTYFRDDEASDLRSGEVRVETVTGPGMWGFEVTHFVERKPDETDWLTTAQAEIGWVPRIGEMGYGRVGVGVRSLILDRGDIAWGAELDLGVQLLPARPFGLNASVRGALMHWDENSAFGYLDVQAGGSLFLGPVELQVGYRRTQFGNSTPFNGPTAGVRLWF